MGSHITTVVPTETREFYGACSCRWRTLIHLPTQQEAEDENMKHLALVEKTRAYVRRSQPNLKETRDYYLSMAETEEDRETSDLWRRLADEITHRLNDTAPPNTGQEHLW